MPRAHATRSPLALATFLFAALTFLALVSASRMVVSTAGRPAAISWFDALGSGLMDWYLWAPLVPPTLLLVRRFPFAQGAVIRALAVHVPAAVAASLLQIVAYAAASALVRQARFGTGDFWNELASGFGFKLHTGVVVYAALVLGAQALQLSRSSRAEELRRVELGRRLSEARLEALQSHLRPHFLFNTLNAVAATLRSDPHRAEEMIVLLGDLLRSVLRHREDQELTLSEELELLEPYVEIQRLRFGERLTVELAVAPDVANARVPSFVLQPLVENAIHHGIGLRPGPGHVRVTAHRREGRLELAVDDDGPGPGDGHPGEGRPGGEGIGVGNTRERLHLLYGDDFDCELGPASGGGARFRLSVPYHEDGA